MKKIKVLSFGLTAALATISLVSCRSSKSDKGLKICLASTPSQIDPALNSTVDGASYAVHLFSGLVRYTPDTNGGLKLSADLAKDLPTAQALEGGKVSYKFTLRDGITYSDGTEIKASDFVASWNRAASHSVVDKKGTEATSDDVTYTGTDADYNYMFEVIDGYAALDEKAKAHTLTANDEFKLNVTADDAAKTLTVVLKVDVPYFYELCAFPAYFVLKDAASLDDAGNWAFEKGYATSGAYSLTGFKRGVNLTMKKNDSYWDAANVKQENLNFIFSDDASATYSQFLSGGLDFSANLSTDIISTEKGGKYYKAQSQLGTYYISWNVNADIFGNKTEEAKEDIRNAISLLINRTSIVENTTKGGELPATGFVGRELSDADGSEFVAHNGVLGDGSGYVGDVTNYEANVTKALEILAKYYTVEGGKVKNFPSINYIYNNDAKHEAIATSIKAQLANYGITLNASSSEWGPFVETRKQGNFDVARNGWVADYNDPISFLDLFTSASGNNDVQLGKGANATYAGYDIDLTGIGSYGHLTGTWAETYDTLISAIKNETNKTNRYKLMHKAEDLLMSTGCITPIYNYVDNWLQQDNLKDVYVSPLGFKYFTWSTQE